MVLEPDGTFCEFVSGFIALIHVERSSSKMLGEGKPIQREERERRLVKCSKWVNFFCNCPSSWVAQYRCPVAIFNQTLDKESYDL